MTRRRFAIVSAASVALAVAALPAGASDGPFAALHGAWSGSGSVRLDNGKTERLRCKGYYTARSGGSGLGMAINCGNASFRINMRANLASAGGSISGTWEEREFNQTGTVAGRKTENGFNLKFTGALSGSMSVAATGTSQTVSISTGGPGFRGANLQFAKSG